MKNDSAWIVDDDRSIRLVLASALRDADLNVREFADAEAMLAALKQSTPHVLFTDVRMDGIGGFELLERLAAMPTRFPVSAFASGCDVDAADLDRVLRRNATTVASSHWTVELRHWADAALVSGRDEIHAEALAAFEHVVFEAALAAHDGHRQNAALQLGVSRNTLTRKLGASRNRNRTGPVKNQADPRSGVIWRTWGGHASYP